MGIDYASQIQLQFYPKHPVFYTSSDNTVSLQYQLTDENDQYLR